MRLLIFALFLFRWYACWSEFLRKQDWTSGKENFGGRASRRCHDFYDGTRRPSNNRGPPTDLPNDKWCSFEHPKTRSHGGRTEGYIDEHAGHPILSGNNHSGFQIHEYGNPFRECHLVESDRESQRPGEWRVRSPPMYTTRLVRAYLLTLQDMPQHRIFRPRRNTSDHF